MTIPVGFNGGKHPGRDVAGFMDFLKKTHPNATEKEIQILWKKAIGRFDTPGRWRVVALFGQDLLTEHPEQLEIWPFLPPSHRRRILAHPVAWGERIPEHADKVAKLEVVNNLNHAAVHRSAIISIEGLKKTYVWCRKLNWVQDVEESDFPLIKRMPIASKLQRMDVHGPIIIPRSYDMVPKERYEARTIGEVEALKREFTRKTLVTGVELPK